MMYFSRSECAILVVLVTSFWRFSPTLAADRTTLLVDGWRFFSEKSYSEAIVVASKCVQQFGGYAKDEQRMLNMNGPEPPIGALDMHSAQASAIFRNGELNDVSACYFILAASQDNLKNCPEAKNAYLALSKLSYARIWDPYGWFWSPSEQASIWLKENSENC